tara:strand:+ start:2771 stop:3367 length:597 start_codon:yes stop_codon:yes gene_type:complete
MLNSHILKNFGSIISYILHPMVVSSFTFWFIIYKTGLSLENPDFIFFLSFFFSTALPIITVLAFIRMNLVKDLDASSRSERLLPMALGALFFLIGFIILRGLNSPNIIQGVMFCGIINTIIVWLITKYWKISIHTVSMTSGIMIFWLLGYKYIIQISIILILTIFSRVITNSHTLSQTIIGALVGLTATYTQLVLLFI